MINSLQEIQDRFDKIKDHKPKAAKKLNELGEILASAYQQDAELADEMWQYLVDLNVKDTPENARFYIAQVFNKLTDRLSAEEATELLALTPERVELMVMYGYEGAKIWQCLTTLIEGFLKMESIENCLVIMELFAEKLEQINHVSTSMFAVVSHCLLCAHQLGTADAQYADIVVEFFLKLKSIDDDYISAYVFLKLIILGYDGSNNPIELLELARKYKFANEFIELIWKYREEIAIDEITRQWVFYLNEIESEQHILPAPNLSEEAINLRKESLFGTTHSGITQMEFFIPIMKNNDEILPLYFNTEDHIARTITNDVAKHLIYEWIVDEDWMRFVRYVSQAILNVKEDQFKYSQIMHILNRHCSLYFQEYYSDDNWSDYGRKERIVTATNITEFTSALASVSAATIGCAKHNEFHETIKEFIQKANGNIDVLADVGFAEQAEVRTPEQRLKDYIHRFMQSGQYIHDDSSGEHERICKAISDEDSQSNSEDGSINHHLERAFNHAVNDEMTEFYFLHCNQAAGIKADMIEACIKKGCVERAIELVELLLRTANYEDFGARYSWSLDMKRVAEKLITAFKRTEGMEWVNRDVTEEQSNAAAQLVERIIPQLQSKYANELRNSLNRMRPQSVDNEAYIEKIMQTVDVYTMFPKPWGKRSAKSLKEMSSDIREAFSVLSLKGRLDVITQILWKFQSAKEELTPVSFSDWMLTAARTFSDEQLFEFYLMNKPLFASWLETHPRDYDINHLAEKLSLCCSHEEFLEFCNLVTSRHGFVAGLTSCYHFTSENTEPQMMYDGDTILLRLEYVQAGYFEPIKEIHILSTSKAKEVHSVRLVRYEINGESVKSQYLLGNFDDGGPTTGFHVFVDNEPEQRQIPINFSSERYGDRFSQGVNSILLQFAVFGENAREIETFSEIIIQRDKESGIYRVTQQGQHIKTSIPIKEHK